MKEVIKNILLEYTKWTDEELRKEAQKYNTYSDFIKLSNSAYNVAKRKSPEFFDDITKHLVKTKKKWDEESLRQEASKYNKVSEFRKENRVAHDKAKEIGIEFFDSITSHMGPDKYKRSIRKWTDDALRKEALKYKTKREFAKNSNSAAMTAQRRGQEFWDEITSHMDVLGSLKRRMIYAFLFDGKVIYIGLTYDITRREKQHLGVEKSDRGTTVSEYIQQTGLEPKLIKLTDYLPIEVAKIKENEFIEKFRGEGYTVLNKVKAGSLGGNYYIWTDEILRNEAKKYNSKNEFKKQNPNASFAAYKRGKEFWNEITSHMSDSNKNWNEDELRQEALKYNNRTEFQTKSGSAYQLARAKGRDFFDSITAHMPLPNQKTKWTDDALRDEALKYKTKSEFQNKSSSAYQLGIRRGKEFWKDITSHMK